MRQARNQVATLHLLTDEPRRNFRRHGRIRCEMLTCGLGDVMDFSASGMRVRHRGRMELEIGDRISLRLEVLQMSQTVRARVVHLKKIGFRRHEIGLEFTELSPEVSAGLTTVFRLAMDTLTLGHKTA